MGDINFIIIGAQKSGTTFIQQSLRRHPQIYMPHYETATFEAPHYTPEAVSALENSLRKRGGLRIVGLKRPDYLARAECSENIKNHFPDVKLIAILRDPIDRIQSAYFHYMRYSDAPIVEIDKGLQSVLSREVQRIYPRAEELIEFGFYYKHLVRYFARFPAENIFICLYDEMQQNQARFLSRLCAFLDIDADLIRPYTNQRKGAAIYSLPRLKFLNFMYQVWYKTEQGQFEKSYYSDPLYLRKAIAHAANLFDRVVLARVFKASKPQLHRELVEQIGQVYIEDAKKLQGLIGYDLGHWKVFSQ